MFTVEKAYKLLDLCKIEFPSLDHEEINIKYGKEFSVIINLFHNDINILKKFEKDNKHTEYLRGYLLKNNLDTNNFMFNDFNEVFSFLHEVGHIYYKNIHKDEEVYYNTFKNGSYYNYREAFYKYREIPTEKAADNFSIVMLNNQKINIWAIMQNISIEQAQEEADFWEFS